MGQVHDGPSGQRAGATVDGVGLGLVVCPSGSLRTTHFIAHLFLQPLNSERTSTAVRTPPTVVVGLHFDI